MIVLSFSTLAQKDSCIYKLERSSSKIVPFDAIYSKDKRYLAIQMLNIKGYAYQKNIIVVIDSKKNKVVFEYSTDKYLYLYNSQFNNDVLFLMEKNKYLQVDLLKGKMSGKKIGRRKAGISRKYDNKSKFDFEPYFKNHDSYVFNNSITIDEKCFYIIEQ